MGTRGIYGWRKNNIDKIAYNHSDSYPSELGRNVIEFIKSTSNEEINNIFDKLIVVDEDSLPNAEQIAQYSKYFSDSNKSVIPTWYGLLRNAQDELESYKTWCSHIEDSSYFIKDSLFCEYGYIVNLDTNKLEIWKGYQTHEDPTNRYGVEMSNGYYPCSLVKEFDIQDIRDSTVDEILEKINSDE